MNKRPQAKDVVIAALILGVFFALALLGSWGDFLYTTATQERSTYSIVAIDPVTGDVGAAGASCVPKSASAAGGDRRCNNPSGFQQTAEAAFITVAKAGQPSFTTPIGQEPSPNDPTLPWLYISVIEVKGRPNPLLDLRSRYNSWRSENLPPCVDCNMDAIPVPPGGNPQLFIKAILTILNRIGLRSVVISCCFTGIVMIIGLFIIFFRRRRKKQSI